MEVGIAAYRSIVVALGLGAVGLGWWASAEPEPPPAKAELSAKEKQALGGVAQAFGLLAIAANDDSAVRQQRFGAEVAEAAHLLQNGDLGGFRDDCSGYVSAVFTFVGVPMDGRVASIWDLAVANDALHWDRPKVGDLVFFDDTHDRDHDRRWDDELTHIGVIVEVEPDGVATFAHAGTTRGRTYGKIDVERPWVNRDSNGNLVNSYVRDPEWGDPSDASYLAGELWVAFATVDPRKDWLGDE